MLRRDRPLASLLFSALSLGELLWVLLNFPAPAQEPLTSPPSVPGNTPTAPASAYLRPSSACPTDLRVLATQLLADLPSYANRVNIRSLGEPERELSPRSSVLVASAPDFTPLALTTSAGEPDVEPNPALQQVFFTTLERQYLADQAVSLQHYHWLFLAPTADGWHLALLYSSLGAYPAADEPGSVAPRPPTPPQESSDGSIGQAIRLWLRDCRAGTVFPAATGAATPSAGASTQP